MSENTRRRLSSTLLARKAVEAGEGTRAAAMTVRWLHSEQA